MEYSIFIKQAGYLHLHIYLCKYLFMFYSIATFQTLRSFPNCKYHKYSSSISCLMLSMQILKITSLKYCYQHLHSKKNNLPIIFSTTQFCHLQNMEDYGIVLYSLCAVQMRIHRMMLSQCVAHSKCPIKVILQLIVLLSAYIFIPICYYIQIINSWM